MGFKLTWDHETPHRTDLIWGMGLAAVACSGASRGCEETGTRDPAALDPGMVGWVGGPKGPIFCSRPHSSTSDSPSELAR